MVYKVWYDLHFIEQETEVQSWESSYNESRTVEGRSVITLMSLPELLKFPFLLVVLLSTAMIFLSFPYYCGYGWGLNTVRTMMKVDPTIEYFFVRCC